MLVKCFVLELVKLSLSGLAVLGCALLIIDSTWALVAFGSFEAGFSACFSTRANTLAIVGDAMSIGCR